MRFNNKHLEADCFRGHQ